MARKEISRRLKRLPKVSPGKDRDHHRDRLLEVMRRVAVINQRDDAQPFHSVREVARHFRVPIATVSQVYRRLEDEGLLNTVRGSKTVLHGASSDRNVSVRGFVGLPASLSLFVTVQDYRMFFIRLRRCLRVRGFSPVMVFYDNRELETSDLSDRLKTYRVDTVIWFQPPARAKATCLGLSDSGVRVLGVSEGESLNLACKYQLRRNQAIEAVLTDWKRRQGVKTVVVAESREHRAATNENALHSALEHVRLKSFAVNYPGGNTDAFLRLLTEAKADGIIFPSAALASLICFRRPAAVTELLKNNRVAFLGGPVNMPFANVPDVTIDLVTFDWEALESAIVDDLITQDAFKRSGPSVFEAVAHLGVPLNHFAQSI